MPILLGGWFLGMMILGLRLLAGVGTVFWWRWSSLPIDDPRWNNTLERLSRQLGLRRCPRLAVSLRAEDAFSLGLIRPLIVVPAAWLLKLPAETLESVLAHELAHIRRWDAWANLFQRVLEAWLFYHPAVWWLSRQMDKEREKCCDLWAVSLTGDRLLYVKTLAGIAELQHANRPAKTNRPILATGMGGKNMVLLERVRHILGETPRTGAASRFLAGMMVLAIPAALWVGTLMLPQAAAQDDENIIAQAEGDEEGNRRRDGDAPKEGPRDGDRERPEGRRDGERERPEGRRDGDRPRGERERDGDRPRGERERDGDRPRPEGERRDGDRPRPEGRDGEGRAVPGSPPRGPVPPFRRDGEGRGDISPQAEMMQLVRELRQEVEQLRKEVQELKEGQETMRRWEEAVRRVRDRERERETEGRRVENANRDKPSAAEARYVFGLLDKNKSDRIEEDEWQRSKAIREGFEKSEIEISLPIDLRTFVESYPRNRIVPQLRLPSETRRRPEADREQESNREREGEEGREALEKAREERDREIDSPSASLGRVSGTVIINGQPLAGAKVEFIPQKGKPSSGVTDQNGRFSLKSSQDISGAALGTHQVSISTATEEAAKETIPPKYNAATSLAAEVVEGNNEFIFELTE